MSAKWRALQHRHRYTYSSTAFPESFIKTLNLLSDETGVCLTSSSSKFLSELKHLVSLNTTYSQVATIKDLASSFTELLSDAALPAEFVSAAAQLYLEILFLENSLPLHRTLISAIAKSSKSLHVIDSCFVSLCEEYGDGVRKGRRRFLLSRAALSLMSYPKLGFLNATIDKCAVSVALDIADGLGEVISDIDHGSRPSPTVMEQCQEALSCLYYLLQRYSSRFSIEEESLSTFKSILRETVSVLKSSAFSRDCLVAAGVSFWAALQVCTSPLELASFIAKGFFKFCGDDQVEEFMKVPYEGDLYSDIKTLSTLGRLCLLRGMLTAVPRTVLNTHFTESSGRMIWTILYNGILPELCYYCENPTDSHFNFHALTVTQICFQQIKTSILSKLIDYSDNYDPPPETIATRILRIIWNNLEDPLSQTVKQVHLIFDLFLDIQTNALSRQGSERTKLFLHSIASDLLSLGPRCKGRYIPLSFLTKRLGAKTLLNMKPRLLYETTHAYIDDDVCCSATSFLKCFLECLRDECWSSDGIETGYEIFRGLCLSPLLQGLVSGLSKLRSNLNTHALPVVLEVDVDSIFPMLAFISVGPNGEESKINNKDITVDQCVAALVSLLKVSRLLALIEGDINWDQDPSSIHKDCYDGVALVCVTGMNVKVKVQWLVLALTHADESIRMDAAETLFLNPKTSSLPSSLELGLMRKAIPLNMRCCSTAFQMKWTSLFRKFFSRVKTALERQVKQGNWQLLECSMRKEENHGGDNDEVFVQRAQDLYCFMKWLSCHLFFSCYPSAPYERKTMAMDLILIIVDVWPTAPPKGNGSIYPYDSGFISPDSTLLLVSSIVDSWDKLRESSYRILLGFPTPLPGISNYDSVKEVIVWAKNLVCSPRVRESDAGALTMRLIFRKYVLELGWMIGASIDVVCFDPQCKLPNGDSNILKSRLPMVEYLFSLIDWLRIVVEEGEKDLSKACRNSFVHGVLLTLRYTFEDLDWNSTVVLSSISEMKHVLEKLLDLVMQITSLALWVVSADAWYLPDDTNDLVDDIDFMSEVKDETDTTESSSERIDGNLKSPDDVGPAAQVVMVGCWLAMKEVSLLLGTIIRKIPLPSSSYMDSSKPDYSISETGDVQTMMISDAMLDFKQLENIGNHFLQVLLKMKHNGAIDKTRAGFTALCNRLLSSNDPRLCKMTESWMEKLMERTIAKGQTVDDLLRRSAGIPAAFIAFFLSEPEGTPKKLLPRALRWLIDVVNMSMQDTRETSSQNDVGPAHKDFSDNLNQENQQSIVTIAEVHGRTSKVRDEGLVHTVHAFNVLRAAFNDTNLATDTSGFCAEALIISIRSFSSPHWEVRNSACLVYTALVRRMIGFLNVNTRESARRALTGLEFFHRYPTLHSFLFNELKIATESLAEEYCERSGSNIAKVIHPSLCPILILLSRLKPSLVSNDSDDEFDPFLLMPFIRRCATQCNLRVRVLASRALPGLVSNERLLDVLVGIANGLPCERNATTPVALCSSVCTANGGPDSGTTKPYFMTFNSIHGILLQLNSLIDTNCRNLTDVSKKDVVLGRLIQVLMTCSWIGSTRSCPCPTLNCSFLQVLDVMLDIARTCKMTKCALTVKNLLKELSAEYLDRADSIGMRMYNPTEVELRRQAAASFFSCLFEVDMETQESFQHEVHSSWDSKIHQMPKTDTAVVQLHEKIMQCLSDSRYEVRVAMLKWLLQFLKSAKTDDDISTFYQWANTKLEPTLMQLLGVEENRKCVYYILRVIFFWYSLQLDKTADPKCKKTIFVGNMDCDSVFSFWNRLVSLNATVTHSKTKEALLCCMAMCVKQFTRFLRNSAIIDKSQVESMPYNVSAARNFQYEGWTKVSGYIDDFALLVNKHSASSEPVNMRKAAAESIIASGLLEEANFIAIHVSNYEVPSDRQDPGELDEREAHFIEPSRAINLYALRILDVWSTSIQLLEDEDEGIRQRLAKDVQTYMSSKASNQSNCSGTVPAQVERVIESCFESLSSIFGHWIYYFDYLSRWALNTASYVVAHGDLVRQVFDKEIDNHHEEKLLISQICCSHLEQILKHPAWALWVCADISKSDVMMFIHRWKAKFLHQLICFASEFIKIKGKADWIGGIGNHKDTFISIYANLLGFHTLLQCPIDGDFVSAGLSDTDKFLASNFVKLRDTIKPFLRNPLISNLYYLVLQSHKNVLRQTYSEPKLNDCSVWKDFDPYFLLR